MVYQLDKNSGSAASNLGLKKCKWVYITFLDIDDLLDADYILEQKRVLDDKVE